VLLVLAVAPVTVYGVSSQVSTSGPASAEALCNILRIIDDDALPHIPPFPEITVKVNVTSPSSFTPGSYVGVNVDASIKIPEPFVVQRIVLLELDEAPLMVYESL